MSNYTPAFSYYKEHFRVVADLYATEEGIFKELPDDVASGRIKIEVVYRVCLATPAGELQIYDFFNPPAMNKDRKSGGPVTIDGLPWFTEPGEAKTPLKCRKVAAAWADPQLATRANEMYMIAESEEGLKLEAP